MITLCQLEHKFLSSSFIIISIISYHHERNQGNIYLIVDNYSTLNYYFESHSRLLDDDGSSHEVETKQIKGDLQLQLFNIQ